MVGGQQRCKEGHTVGLCEANDWEWLNAYAIDEVKDAAGAGDWCTAGIVHRLGQQGLQGLQQVTATQLLDALCFGQALAAWNCGFEGARGGMYSVPKKVFRCDIEQIMAGKGPQRPVLEYLNRAEKEVLRTICPRHCQRLEQMVTKMRVRSM